MERLGNTRPTSGLHAGSLRAWGMLFAIAGIISRGILQNKMLGVGSLGPEELKALMDNSDTAMIIATIALVLQAMETVAVPIFVFLLAEGFRHTSDWKKYFVRVAGLAVLTEIPFDLAVNGKVLDLTRTSAGKYDMTVAYNDSFTGVFSGLDYAYYQAGQPVCANVPIGFSDGETAVQVSLFWKGELLNCFELTDENCLTWATETENA
jgi:hypothetical protein